MSREQTPADGAPEGAEPAHSTAEIAYTTQRDAIAAHDVRIHHGGGKQFQHPDAGPLKLVYQPLDLPISPSEVHSLTIYTAEPGTPDEDRLKLLASWAATRLKEADPARDREMP
ncbi:hypothetical protein BSZ07_36025 [Streptomyces sp. M1013]|uniref:MmyB family transcriptional regulator n=1 Tax=Streptomyces sp. M1013 TaxID=549798 RepID=UPI000978F271|nr:hypothetical protein [Streptomyces sp. M1013]OMI84699.1 hypothetical protein BSZ07_36025 [Streptomyces sp. M1013]